MSELISWMIRYMENDRFSKWQKLSRLLWVLFVAFVIDNAFGLSSIVYNSFKLDYLVKVEDARRRFGNDKELGYAINCMHEDVVYHKSARECFYEMFIGDNSHSEYQDQIKYEEGMKHRNRYLHVFSSAALPLVLMYFCFSFVLVSIMVSKKNMIYKTSYYLWGIVIFGYIAYRMQYFFGRMPLVMDSEYMTYFFQLGLNIIIGALMIWVLKQVRIHYGDSNQGQNTTLPDTTR